MKKTTLLRVACVLAIANVGITVADQGADVSQNHDGWFRYARLGTVAIPCVPDELRFSCSNKSPRRSLYVLDAKCFVGAGDDPDVVSLDNLRGEVNPETTEVVPVPCGAGPVFCTARVYPRTDARCALTSRTGGLNAELR